MVAKRLGSGLQNRLNRSDSDPRLHFFCSEILLCQHLQAEAGWLFGILSDISPAVRLVAADTDFYGLVRSFTDSSCRQTVVSELYVGFCLHSIRSVHRLAVLPGYSVEFR